MQLPLQVFEPRYLEMIRLCLEGDSIFGVNLINSGPEVGGDAEPFPVGTTARIVSAQVQDDGRILLVARGEQRYRIVRTDRSRPYVRADVVYLPEERSAADTPISRRVFEQFRGVLEEMGLQVEFAEELLNQPERVSYLVAAHLTRNNVDKLQLLETNSVQRRLELEEQWVAETLKSLRARKKLDQLVGRNGRMRKQ